MTDSSLASEHQQKEQLESETPIHHVASPSALETTQESSDDKATETAAFSVQGFKLYAILVGVCFGAFMMSLDVFIVSTVSRALKSRFLLGALEP